MRQLIPEDATPGRELGPDRLAELYAYPTLDSGSGNGRPWVRANMVASADGAAHLNGRSAGLSGDADHRIFGLLRSLAGVVLVGAGTVRDEHYRPAQPAAIWPELRAGRTVTPPIAVISRRLDLDPQASLFTGAPPDARTIVITTEQAPAAQRAKVSQHAEVIVAGSETVDLKAALTGLAALGHLRVLTEGGPHLLSQLVAGGLLDELCLTVSPLLAGPGPGRIVAGPVLGGQEALGGAPLTLGHVLEDSSFLFCRYTVPAEPRRGQPASPLG